MVILATAINSSLLITPYAYSNNIVTTSAGALVMDLILPTKGLYLINVCYIASTDIPLGVVYTLPNAGTASILLGKYGGTFLYKSDSDNYKLELRTGGSQSTTWSRRWYSFVKLR